MKQLFFPALLCAAVTASAAVNISMPGSPSGTITIVETTIDTDSLLSESTVELAEGKASFIPKAAVPTKVVLKKDNRRVGTFFVAAPSENIQVNIDDNLTTYTGTPLMEGISGILLQCAPIEQEAATLEQLGLTDPEKAQEKYEQLVQQYDAVFTTYLQNNPDGPAVLYALLNLDPEPFMEYYAQLTPAQKSGLLMPIVEKQKTRYEEKLAAELKTKEMQSGTYPAPMFTLPGLDDTPVSLADFRGKWVVLDFWGSWCRWCIKGFPELKEAYKEFDGKLVVIGIDNNDPKERWKEAVRQYELPWVNVYNDCELPAGKELLQAYGIQGFPTKMIIDPEGIIRHITVGEDPEFYNALRQLIK